MGNRESAFTEEPNLIVEEYRPILPLAVVSVVVGIASVISLLNAYLIIVPVVGAIVGVIALIRATMNRHRVSGLWVASAGLALSLFFAGWATTQSVADNSLVYHQARDHAKFWFTLLQDQKIYHAYELKLPYPDRKLPGVDLAEVYKERGEGFFANTKVAAEMETELQDMSLSKKGFSFTGFVSREPFRSIYEHAANGEFEFVRDLGIRHYGVKCRVSQLYHFNYLDERNEQQQIEFVLEMERVYYPNERVYHWNVSSVLFPGER